MKKNKIICIVVAMILTVSLFSACAPLKMGLDDYDGKEFHVTSNNEEVFNQINELSKRLLRYDDETRIGDIDIPEGNTFNMGWQTKSLVWHNASEEAVGRDMITPIYSGFLKTMAQDDYGYIYDNNYFRETEYAQNNEGYANLPQGWPFPTWKSSAEDSFMDGVTVNDVHFTTFEFDSINEPSSRGWKAENGTAVIEFSGYMTLDVNSAIQNGQSFKVYNDSLKTLLPLKGGIDTTHASFVEIDLDFSSSNLEDYYLVWQTEEGGDEWFRASSKEYTTVKDEYFASYGRRTYWPMYLNENWANKTVTALGIEFVPKDGEILSLNNARVNYIRPSYDTRQTQFTFQWIESFYEYVTYTRDISVLEELMPKARRALSFLLHTLEGESGLLNIGYFYGHNGIGTTINDDGTVTTHVGQGIGTSYWDILALPGINLESNAYFYTCLMEMAQLEKACETYLLTTEPASVKNRVIGEEDYVYDYDYESLCNLASLVKKSIESDVKPVLKEDGTWTNEGGLWNPETGRFALGVREDNGKVVDHGYVYFNEQAIVAGIGTDAQQLSVMQWINGDRTVASDLSKGEDIYFYEFAPRFTTADCSEQINFTLAKAFFGENSPYREYGTLFSHQVQNGGAVLCWSYYDLVARAKVLGADNAYERLCDIASWYKKVKNNTTEDGVDFFKGYYDYLNATSETGVYKLQNAEDDGPGALGLDGEFLENVLFVRAVPEAILGMTVNEFDTLTFTNDFSKDNLRLCLDNLKFGNATFTVATGRSSLEIKSVSGAVHKNTKVELRFPVKGSGYTVFVNNAKSTDYVEKDGYIVVTVALTNVKVSVQYA